MEIYANTINVSVSIGIRQGDKCAVRTKVVSIDCMMRLGIGVHSNNQTNTFTHANNQQTNICKLN